MADPKTNLCDDLNKLVTPDGGKKTGGLAPREARSPIGEHRGSGRDVVSEESDDTGVGEITDNVGTLESADGMFAVVYSYHSHDA